LLEEQLIQSGADGLAETLPEETQKILEELGLEEPSREGIFNLSLHSVWQVIVKTASMFTNETSRVMLSVWGILLLSALLESIRPAGDALLKVFHAASVLCCGMLLLSPLQTLLDGVQTVLAAASAFQLSFVPIFAGIMAAGGQAVTAGKYAALTIGAAQSSSVVLSAVILPLLRSCMALHITSAAAPAVRMDGLCGWVRKTMTTLLSLLMTLFMSVMALQGAVGGAADSLADRTAQFVIGNSIPVVGGALSQAYGSVRGYVRLLKNTVGAFGMLAAGALILPQVVSLILWRTMLDLCAAAGEMLGQREIAGLLRNISGLLGVVLGVVLCGGLMVIVSTGVMLLVRGGT
jgi:stage III sporulation protein AE